ncbi:hypothetical protein EC960109_5953 [Escherichia coli 96.0109]|nr:hypothetical protein EC960109_5953 [Escherichia coli 96.0109]
MFSSNTDIYVDKKIHNKQEERHPDKEPNIWHHGQVSCNRKYKTNPPTPERKLRKIQVSLSWR